MNGRVCICFQDEFIYVIGQIVVNPSEICALFIDGCGTPPIDPTKSTWTLPIPDNKPPYVTPKQPAANAPTLKVLHLSDLHIDMQYKPGTEGDCSEPMCCRDPNDPNEKSSKDIKSPAGYWGHIGNCDAPYWLFVSMMQNIAANHKDLDYVVVSGDYESHADWNYKHSSHQAMIANISLVMQQYLPNIPIYFTVGNHEGVPIDNFAPHWTPQQFWMDWLYGSMADAWKQWVPADQDSGLRYRGSYMKQLYPGLRLISLNNGLGDSNNFYLYINQTDPDESMTWFIQQLSDAEKAGDKVHVVAHIPGGAGEMLESWSLVYYQAVNRFENTVVAQFFGHTHSDEFYVSYLDPSDFRSRPTSVVFSAPSLTTYSDYQPAYRVCTIDGNYPGSSFQILDFEEWFLNLTEANANPSNPTWQKLYSAKDEYGLSSMLPSEWNNMIERMKTDDALFDKYRKNYYRRNNIPCDAKCRNGFLCDCRQLHHEGKLCSDLTNSPTIKKTKGKKKNVERPPIDLNKERKALQDLKAKSAKCPI
uniref:Sphingomyelin phosphodiesterase n=1 Tax=Plectus sambesii TaxID=2011161 RepID=A0A914VBV9_9BILA